MVEGWEIPLEPGHSSVAAPRPAAADAGQVKGKAGWPGLAPMGSVGAVQISAGATLVGLGLATGLFTLALAGAAVVALAAVGGNGPEGGRGPRRLARWAMAVVAVALVATVVGGWWFFQPAPPDGFYAAPDDVPDRPGVLLRIEPFTRGVPHGARGWRVLYTTTRPGGTAAVASGLVLAAVNAPEGPRPVILWAHGTTGADPACAPSMLPAPNPFDPTIPALDRVIAEGWVFVAPDYIGLGTEGPHPYLVGEGQARSVLDAVRAAREIPELTLADRTVVWGHSQGGHAALWTGIVGPEYAPDVALAGVAALAPASDVAALVENVKDTYVGKVIAAMFLRAYAETYADISAEALVRADARWLARDMASRCLAMPSVIPSTVQVTLLKPGSIWAVPPSSVPALARRMEENTPRRAIAAPVVVAQGLEDDLVLPAVQDTWVARRCADGHALEYWTYAGHDHGSVVGPGSPLGDDLMAWTTDRFDGRPAPPSCRASAR